MENPLKGKTLDCETVRFDKCDLGTTEILVSEEEVDAAVSPDGRSQLGVGEYRPTDGSHDVLAFHARREFFAALDRRVPEVPEDLSQTIFPAYVRADEALARRPAGADFLSRAVRSVRIRDCIMADGGCAESTLDLCDETRELREILLGWANKYRLNRPWVLEIALGTMARWLEYRHLTEQVLSVFVKSRDRLCDRLPFLNDQPGVPQGQLVSHPDAVEERLATCAKILKRPAELAEMIASLEEHLPFLTPELTLDALTVLEEMRVSPAVRPAWHIRLHLFVALPGYFTFSTEEWRPEIETRKAFRKRAESAFKIAMRRYIQQTEQRAEDNGLRITPQNHHPERFEWLVLHQVADKSIAAIVRESAETGVLVGSSGEDLESNRKTVARGIDCAAELVDGESFKSWLRPREPGAPKKCDSE